MSRDYLPLAIERMDMVRIDDNTTEIRTLSTYQTVADRDGMGPKRDGSVLALT